MRHYTRRLDPSEPGPVPRQGGFLRPIPALRPGWADPGARHLRNRLVAELFNQVRAVQEDVQAFDEEVTRLRGINFTDLWVLGTLDRREPVTVTEPADDVGLTGKARARTGVIWGPPWGAEVGEFVQGYSKEDLDLLVDYLKRGRALLERHRTRLEGID